MNRIKIEEINYDDEDYNLIAELIQHSFQCLNQKKRISDICKKFNIMQNKCLENHLKCKPKIKNGMKNLNMHNQIIKDISHCSCDQQLYSCLKEDKSYLNNFIGKVYFNFLKVKCFYFEYRLDCKLFILGTCLIKGKPICLAQSTSSPFF